MKRINQENPMDRQRVSPAAIPASAGLTPHELAVLAALAKAALIVAMGASWVPGFVSLPVVATKTPFAISPSKPSQLLSPGTSGSSLI